MTKSSNLLARLATAIGSLFRRSSRKDGKPRFDTKVHQQLVKGLGSDFPADYLEFLRSFDGRVPEKDFYWVVPGDWGSGIDSLYLMMPESEDHPSLLQALDWDGLPLKPGLVPIGGDGCFGYILLSLNAEDRGAVYFCTTWDDDGKTDFYESQGYWKLANSFSGFLAGLQASPDE